jgi:hypothetical protein
MEKVEIFADRLLFVEGGEELRFLSNWNRIHFVAASAVQIQLSNKGLILETKIVRMKFCNEINIPQHQNSIKVIY